MHGWLNTNDFLFYGAMISLRNKYIIIMERVFKSQTLGVLISQKLWGNTEMTQIRNSYLNEHTFTGKKAMWFCNCLSL